MFGLKKRNLYDLSNVSIPHATVTREQMEYTALLQVLEKIETAKTNGNTSVFINSVPKSVIQKLINSGYDIVYTYHDDRCYSIRVFWIDDCNGTIYHYNHGICTKVTIDDMYSY